MGSAIAGHRGHTRQLLGAVLDRIQTAENNTAQLRALRRTDFRGPDFESVYQTEPWSYYV